MTGTVDMVEPRDVLGRDSGVKFFDHSEIAGMNAGTSHVEEASSQPAPERRVHGGSLMALLGAERSTGERSGVFDGKMHGGIPAGFLSLRMG
jgi:hypothetical protein